MADRCQLVALAHLEERLPWEKAAYGRSSVMTVQIRNLREARRRWSVRARQATPFSFLEYVSGVKFFRCLCLDYHNLE